jgi:hypothetical protein
MGRLKRIGSKQNGDCELNSHQSETANASGNLALMNL